MAAPAFPSPPAGIPNDFIFAPGNFENRRELYYEGIDLVRRLWRGESANFQTGADARLDVHIHPRPRQAELPTWFTCIHRDAFVKAGELGANVLCHTVNQSLEEIAGKVAAYREARARVRLRSRPRHAPGPHLPRPRRRPGRRASPPALLRLPHLLPR